MKCLTCGRWSFHALCEACLDEINLTTRARSLPSQVKVYSFYRYADVAHLMQSKYHLIGSRILSRLALKAARHFFAHWQSVPPEELKSHGLDSETSESSSHIALLGLDDYPYSAYSHVGVILKAFATATKERNLGEFKPCFGALRAQNHIKYAGQSLEFRQKHPKGFALTKPISAPTIVLLDDIITTGTSFEEGISVLREAGFAVPFCLSLCDARD